MSENTCPTPKESFGKRFGLLLAFIVLVGIFLLPTPQGLPIAGQRMIGILFFSVIIWMLEAVPYPVSAVVITVLMAFSLGLAPDMAQPEKMLGTDKALSIALGGFASTAWALVAAALFLAAAMMITGLDKRIALFVMSKIGAKTNRVLMGVIFVGFALSFFVPSTTARVSCMLPIVLGIINAFGVKAGSRFAAVLMIAIAQADSLWNVGIKTAAAQNMVAIGFIKQVLGQDISWIQWFIAAAPFSAIMSVILYYLLLKLMPPEVKEIEGGQEKINKMVTEMGPITLPEKRLLFYSCCLLFFWVTEKTFHSFDTATVTIAGIMIMFLPKIGVMQWKDAVPKINWGTIVLFGTGISLGSALLKTNAAIWLAKEFVTAFGMEALPALAILAILAFFLIVIHLGFASATGLAAAMIPIIISILQSVTTPGINTLGLTMILQYVISFGFILPVNAPQNMIAFGSGMFTPADFIKTGLPLTVIAYVLILIFGATYWSWLGYV